MSEKAYDPCENCWKHDCDHCKYAQTEVRLLAELQSRLVDGTATDEFLKEMEKARPNERRLTSLGGRQDNEDA